MPATIKEPWCYNKPLLLNHQRISFRLFEILEKIQDCKLLLSDQFKLILFVFVSATIFKIAINPIQTEKKIIFTFHKRQWNNHSVLLSFSSSLGLHAQMTKEISRSHGPSYKENVSVLKSMAFPNVTLFQNFNFLKSHETFKLH